MRPLHLLPTWRTGYKHKASPGCFCRPRRRTAPDGLLIYVHDWKFKHVAAVYEDTPMAVTYCAAAERVQ
jgi:hypothetical protein